MNNYDSFIWTLKLGEKQLGLTYKDYVDAYNFSEKNYSELSKHFIEHFLRHSDCPQGTYEQDLFRYFFIKAIEHRVSSDFYSNTSRGNVCDIFWSPLDVVLPIYPTNLPLHLERIVNSNQNAANKLADSICNHYEKNQLLNVGSLNALQFLGQTVGYRIGHDNLYYKGYSCSDFLTRNEIMTVAISNFCNWLNENKIEIIDTNNTRDTCQNIIAKKDGSTLHILVSAEVTPEEPGFNMIDLNNLFNYAAQKGAVPYYVSMSIGSQNEKHFRDGVVLYDDELMYKVNAFDVLEEE